MKLICNLIALTLLFSSVQPLAAEDKPFNGLTLVVMDPLALPLSCPCVQGYAQRDYEKLAAYLSKEVGREVRVFFNESLGAALKKDTGGVADLVIGKHSVVVADAKKAGLNLTPTLSLTGKDGQTLMTGLIVVPSTDPAAKVADLKGYRIIFGTPECDEKYSAAMELLKANNIVPPANPETRVSCSDGATTILELGKDAKAATVISSYAAPLLEGCGTIKKGDLRVVGVTSSVPFVEAFLSDRLSTDVREAVQAAMLKVVADPELCQALETKRGFIALQKKS